jgi:hypothetical protein
MLLVCVACLQQLVCNFGLASMLTLRIRCSNVKRLLMHSAVGGIYSAT